MKLEVKAIDWGLIMNTTLARPTETKLFKAFGLPRNWLLVVSGLLALSCLPSKSFGIVRNQSYLSGEVGLSHGLTSPATGGYTRVRWGMYDGMFIHSVVATLVRMSNFKLDDDPDLSYRWESQNMGVQESLIFGICEWSLSAELGRVTLHEFEESERYGQVTVGTSLRFALFSNDMIELSGAVGGFGQRGDQRWRDREGTHDVFGAFISFGISLKDLITHHSLLMRGRS